MTKQCECLGKLPKRNASVRQYIAERIIFLRHGCICSDKYTLLSYQKIAYILGVNVKTVELALTKWFNNGLQVGEDQRVHNGRFKKLTIPQIELLTSNEVLQRQASMTLCERSEDIWLTYKLRVAPALLYSYYNIQGVSYRLVDLAVTAKMRKAAEIRTK